MGDIPSSEPNLQLKDAPSPHRAEKFGQWKRDRRFVDVGILVFSVTLIAWVWAAAIMQTRFERHEAIDAAIASNNNLASAFEQYVTRTLQQADTTLLVLRREYARASGAVDIPALINDGVLDSNLFAIASIVDERGDLIATSLAQPAPRIVNVFDREHFQVHVARDNGRPYIGKPVVSRLLGVSTIPITRRINRTDGSFGGIAVIQITPSIFTHFYDSAKFGPLDSLSLLRMDGTALARRVGTRQSSGEDLSAAEVFLAQRRQPNGWYLARGALDDIPRYRSYRTLAKYSLVVTSGVPEMEVLARAKARAKIEYGAAFIITVIVVTFGSLLQMALTRRRRVVTALGKSEAQLRATFDQSGTGILCSAIDGRILKSNTKACEILGYSADELALKSFFDLNHPDDIGASKQFAQSLLDGDCAAAGEFEKRYVRRDGATIWAKLTAALVRDAGGTPQYFVSMLQDVTERKAAEDKLRRLSRARSIMADCNRILVRASDEETLIRDMCSRFMKGSDYVLAWVGYCEQDERQSIRPIAQQGAAAHYLQEAQVSWGENERGNGTSGVAIRTGSPCVVYHILARPDLAIWHDLAIKYGFMSVASFPLFLNNDNLGVFTVHAREVAAFDPEEIAMLEELADDMAYGIVTLRAREAGRRNAAALREAERFSRSTIDALSKHIAVIDADGVVLTVNRAWHNFAVSHPELPVGTLEGGNYLEALRLAAAAGDKNAQLALSKISSVASGGQYSAAMEYSWTVDDEDLWFILRVTSFSDDGPRRIVLSRENVTQLRKSERQIDYLATHDATTGLPNRMLLEQRLDTAAGAGGAFGLFSIEIDRFEFLADAYGPVVADAILEGIARELVEIVGSGSTVARLSGGHYAVLFTRLENPAIDSADMVSAMLARIRQPRLVDERELTVTTSIGIAIFPTDGRTFVELMRNADSALRSAKSVGHGAFQFYSPELGAEATERASLEIDLRSALSLNQFELHYQPQVRIGTDQVVGMEALLRWRHPAKGLISPAKFIPLAEDSGQIKEIGAWALRQACLENKAWQDGGMTPLVVSVNLSAVQLRDPGLVAMVEKILVDTGLPPRYLDLELTESMVMGRADTVVPVLLKLKALGLALSMDDFGTGYSNLGYLHSFPLDLLKIDQSFIRNLPSDTGVSTVVRAITGLGRSLGMDLIAEGVETLEQADAIQEMGCEKAQGYLYSRPLPPGEFAAWVAGWTAARQR